MQFTFLSAEDLHKPDLNSQRELTSEEIIKKVLPNFQNWLINNKDVTPLIKHDKVMISEMKYGFKKMYNVFMGETPRLLPDITQFYELISATMSGEENKLIHQGKRSNCYQMSFNV